MAFATPCPVNAPWTSRVPLKSTSALRRPASHVTCPARTVVVARVPSRRQENVPGLFYVDSSCIDCDTCRWFCPSVFHRDGEQAAVYAQPDEQADVHNALLALKACPTGSIRTEKPHPGMRDAAVSFPQPALDRSVSPPQAVQNVYFNGDTSRHSFAAASWTVLTSAGAIMIDCPRYSDKLASKLEALAAPYGGFQYIVLTHADDVHGHDRWAARLNAKRVIHTVECNSRQGTDQCEVRLSDGDFPFILNDETVIHHVPGHTKGSIVIHHEPTKSLFTGDHLYMSGTRGGLIPSPMYCFYSWEIQRDSVLKLADIDFLHGWPGHGRPFHFSDAAERRKELAKSADVMSTM